MSYNTKDEPKTAPQSDQWFNLSLGSSFKEDSSSKYCTLRYEFRPASIDKTKPGSLHKNKENRVSVKFQNNQLGKPKVTFEGSSEDYKENDAVLFFDGQTFWLERLHRAVKQLRHLRMPGESAAAASVDPKSPPPVGKSSKPANIVIGRSTLPPLPVEVERIDIGEPQIPDTLSAKGSDRGTAEPAYPTNLQNVPTFSPSPKKDDGEEHHEIDIEELFGSCSPAGANTIEDKVDVGVEGIKQKQNDTDDEIADVDDSDDEANRGCNAAETLRAQVNAEETGDQTTSSSSSSGSGTSGSGSGSGSSNSSDSDSDEETVNSI